MSAASDVVSIAGDTVMFLCPGCDGVHALPVDGKGWTWNKSTDSPTFTPSVFVNKGRSNPAVPTCHSFVTDGRIRYLNDCDHPMAGQTADLPLWASRYDADQ